MRAESVEAALASAREDVYVQAGVWCEISVRPVGRFFSSDLSVSSGEYPSRTII